MSIITPLEISSSLSFPFIALHESLNLVDTFFWLCAYATLLRKLRQEKSAAGLSLQTLLALYTALQGGLLNFIILDIKPKNSLRLIRLFCTSIKCLVSLFGYISIVSKHRHTYEDDQDTFGTHPLNLCCLKFKVLHRQIGQPYMPYILFRFHWITLYIYSILFGFLLQLARTSQTINLFGIWECFVDLLMAFAFIPQLHMFWNSRDKFINELLGRFLIWILCSKIISFLYWLTDALVYGFYFHGRGIHMAGEMLNILILIDFSYYYFLSKSKGYCTVVLPI